MVEAVWTGGEGGEEGRGIVEGVVRGREGRGGGEEGIEGGGGGWWAKVYVRREVRMMWSRGGR